MDSFCYLCFVFVCHTVLSVPCSLVVTSWKRADFLALLYVMFLVFLSLSHMLSWYLIVSIPDTVKSRLSERRLSETTGLFEDDGQSRVFSLLFIAIKLPIIRNFDYPKNSIFRSDSSVPIKEIAIKLPFKIRIPNVTHGDHDFFVWLSSIYTPERFSKQSCNS